jgi:hypothetical protein
MTRIDLPATRSYRGIDQSARAADEHQAVTVANASMQDVRCAVTALSLTDIHRQVLFAGKISDCGQWGKDAAAAPFVHC